jgi:hypothetical protein
VIYPLTNEAYPMGLHPIQIIDAFLLTFCMVALVAFSKEVRAILEIVFPGLSEFGRVIHLLGFLGAIVIGYYAYADIVIPPLSSVGLEIIYSIIFWIFIALITALLFINLVQILKKKKVKAMKTLEAAGPGSTLCCPSCGKKVNPGDVFCRNCGAKLKKEGQN